MSNRNILMTIRGISPEELMYLEHATKTFSEEQTKHFVFIYSGKRKNTQDILLFTLLGFLGFAGIQRFVLNQVAMGIIYFLTLGFCWIGTVVDLINHKSMTDEYNQRMARDAAMMVMGGYI
ncbi:MAG TPA: TM2 domain-containing protein [Parapedobacter sp.]|uniref:TM2 domain-containing protein n=1 Tax=Parapedobacter sp. TaxID=1958893 RepID=UPI002C8B4131|nr:TM2 domain-containing protein [Parapedobacter sp.]HWK56791.1 TM2 domain-containing protein [Parapedobacter sp.]